MFLRSIPTSAVTPSPNRKLEAATCLPDHKFTRYWLLPAYLKSVLFVTRELNWSRELSQLVKGWDWVVVMVMRDTGSMTRA